MKDLNLLSAVHSNDVDAAKEAIKNGADKNSRYIRQITPIMDAVSYGAFDVLKYLVSIGADYMAKDANRATCLYYLNSDNVGNIVDMFYYLISLPELDNTILKRESIIKDLFRKDIYEVLENMWNYD